MSWIQDKQRQGGGSRKSGKSAADKKAAKARAQAIADMTSEWSSGWRAMAQQVCDVAKESGAEAAIEMAARIIGPEDPK